MVSGKCYYTSSWKIDFFRAG